MSLEISAEKKLRLLTEIKQASREKVTILDLSGRGLLELPTEIGQLAHLTKLYLENNQLTTLPPEIGQLTNLRSLYLDNNQLTTLPPEIGQLTNLTKLSFYGNKLTTIPPELGQLTHLKALSLRKNKLLTLPPELGQLIALDSLFISENQLKHLPPEVGSLGHLKELYAKTNQLGELPPELGQLSNLTRLDLAQNQLTSVPPALGQLSKLARLDLYQNQLTSVPPELGQLSNLARLDLAQNQLTSVPPALGQLSQLTRLYLYHNQLTLVPPELSHLSNLTVLSLHQNKLTFVPTELGQLANLTVLSLYKNQLSSVPTELGQLASLAELYLSQNQLTSVPTELGQLSNLTILSLSHNQLSSVPTELGQKLSNLAVLCLDQNQFASVPDCVRHLKKLERIDLNDNNLQSLPHFMEQPSQLNALLLHGNHNLNVPNDILGPTYREVNDGSEPANPSDILKYYFEIQESEQPLNEAKLILVGFGAVGKTSLVNRLINNSFDPSSQKTDGIQITPWRLTLNETENITLNVWDFGGQEIMHSTHQFFLTERSLYLLVLNGRQGREDEDAEYWLELIKSFGGNSPVIVVLNKINEHAFDVNRGDLQQKFPNIRDFIKTDCGNRSVGIDRLRQALEREIDALEHLRVPFPASWFGIKQKLATMSDNFITFEKYTDICEQNKETDVEKQNALASYLHSLGIALNYKDDPRLRDTHVLKPTWVTNGIYTLLNTAELTESKGELTESCLSQALNAKDYPLARHGFLLDLMRKFEICFRFQEDETRYLIPDLLDKQQPHAATDFDLSSCLNFCYTYPILPEGILPRFIVRTHVLSEQQLRWRTGVILTFEGNRALVKADRQNRSITISVDGALPSRRRLLAIIRSDFDRIHSSFRFVPEELVPVPGHPSVTVKYKELLARERRGSASFDIFIGNDDLLTLQVEDLLNGVDIEGSRRQRDDRSVGLAKERSALRLFYSYSHKDEVLREELETHLKILERQGLILPWSDRRIQGGEDWAAKIDNNLKRADIILLLVSANFIASDYCYEKEMRLAMERHRTGEAQVIPIRVRPADYEGTPFEKLQGFPTGMKAVTQWGDRHDAWFDIETGIKNTIEMFRDRR